MRRFQRDEEAFFRALKALIKQSSEPRLAVATLLLLQSNPQVVTTAERFAAGAVKLDLLSAEIADSMKFLPHDHLLVSRPMIEELIANLAQIAFRDLEQPD